MACAVAEACVDVEAEDAVDLDGTKETTVVCAMVAVAPVELVNIGGLEAAGPPVLELKLGIVLPDPVCEGCPASELV